MTGDEKYFDFDPDFKKVVQHLSYPSKKSFSIYSSAFIGHITRLINKIDKKLSLNNNFKTIKCLEDQLDHILEILKSVNDEYTSSAMNPEDIENASEIYFEQNFRVITTSAFIKDSKKTTKG